MWMPKIQRVRVGQYLSADDFNDVAARLERFYNLRVEQGSALEIDSGSWGHALTIRPSSDLWAQLTGSSSPYSWHEVTADTAGAWVSYGNLGGTSNAYEINGTANLNGKVVQLGYTAAGDWRFVYEGVKPPTIQWTFVVNGCASIGLAGVLITVKQSGVTITTCTTGDGTGGTTLGQCVVNVPAGTYQVTATPPTGIGFVANTQTVVHNATQTTTFNLGSTSVDPAYVCFCSGNYPIPRTLRFTDGIGAHTVTFNGTRWTTTVSTGMYTTVNESTFPPCATGGNLTVIYSLSCVGGNQFSLSVAWKASCCPQISGTPTIPLTYADDADGAFTTTNSASPAASFTENPFFLTVNVPATATAGLLTCAGFGVGNGATTPGGGGSIPITP